MRHLAASALAPFASAERVALRRHELDTPARRQRYRALQDAASLDLPQAATRSTGPFWRFSRR